MNQYFKTLFVVLISVLFATNINAQVAPNMSTKYNLTEIKDLYKQHKVSNDRDVVPPPSLSEKFNKDFPKARDVDWEKSGVLYEVDFEIGWIGKTDYKAYYDLEGNLVMYREEISNSSLPAIVKNAALTKYPNYRIDDIDKIVAGKDTLYKVSLEKGDMDVKLVLTHDGTTVNEYFD